MTAPSHRYYRFFEGSWSAPLHLQLLALPALAIPSWSGCRMNTSVRCDLEAEVPEVFHTTRASWLGIPLYISEEWFALDPDGQRFAIRGRLLWPTFWRPDAVSGTGRVEDGDNQKASYAFVFRVFGIAMALTQDTVWREDHLEIRQTTRFLTGVQRLRRL